MAHLAKEARRADPDRAWAQPRLYILYALIDVYGEGVVADARGEDWSLVQSYYRYSGPKSRVFTGTKGSNL